MIVGDTFGKWTVLELGKHFGRPGAKVRCTCGHERWHTQSNLNRGNTTQCRACSYLGFGPHPHRVMGDLLAAKDCYSTYKSKAKGRGLDFEITFDTFYEQAKQPCFYCGAEPANRNRIPEKDWADDFVYNGLDRLENNLGYTTWNVVPCCWKCNYMKRDLDYQDFFNHCQLLAERWPGVSAIALAGKP